MNYCTRCVYPANHALGIVFDGEGVCSGCRVHEEKDEIDWAEKRQELERLLDRFRARPGSSYDCVIPVRGDGDSFFVVHAMKKWFGLRPLLVTYNSHFNTKIGIRNLARLITELDCDHLHYTVGPEVVRRVTRISFRTVGHMYWHAIAGHLTFPAQAAAKFGIPLVVWPVNGYLDQVGMFSHHDAVEMTKKVRKEHGLRRFDAEDLVGREGLTEKDLQAYKYPSDEELERARVRGLYLGNFIRWDAQRQIEEMIRLYGYETAEEERTFNTYETHGCWNEAGVHDYVKFLKYGYGKATDHASRDVRLGRMTREEAIDLVDRFDGVVPRHSIDLFLSWLGMDEEEFLRTIEPFRDPRMWQRGSTGAWDRLDSVANHRGDPGVEAARLPAWDLRHYLRTPQLEQDGKGSRYYLLGRAYMDEKNYRAVEG